MGAWEKFQLGWLNYEVAAPARLEPQARPAETNTKQAQGALRAPARQGSHDDIGAPFARLVLLLRGSGNNLDMR